MKDIRRRKEKENKEMQCVLCQANFGIWIDNLKTSAENKEKLRQDFLKYCPVCTRKDES